MTNVHELDGSIRRPADEPQAWLIATLEDLLERAKAGQLQSFAGAGVNANGTTATIVTPYADDAFALIGALEYVRHQQVRAICFLNEGDEEADD